MSFKVDAPWHVMLIARSGSPTLPDLRTVLNPCRHVQHVLHRQMLAHATFAPAAVASAGYGPSFQRVDQDPLAEDSGRPGDG